MCTSAVSVRGCWGFFFFSSWAVPVQPGRKSTGKKTSVMSQNFLLEYGNIFYDVLHRRNSTFGGVFFSVGLSLYKLVGNQPERKNPCNHLSKYFGASHFFQLGCPCSTGRKSTGKKNPCANRLHVGALRAGTDGWVLSLSLSLRVPNCISSLYI